MKIQDSLKSLFAGVVFAAGLPTAWAEQSDKCAAQKPDLAADYAKVKQGVVDYSFCLVKPELANFQNLVQEAKGAAGRSLSFLRDETTVWTPEYRRRQIMDVAVPRVSQAIRNAAAREANVLTLPDDAGDLAQIPGNEPRPGSRDRTPAPSVIPEHDHDVVGSGGPIEPSNEPTQPEARGRDAAPKAAAKPATEHHALNGFAKSALFGSIGLGALNMFANRQAGEGSMLSSLATYGALIGGSVAAMKYGGTAGTIAALGLNGAIAAYSLFKARHTLAEHEKKRKAEKDGEDDDGDPKGDGGGDEGDDEPPPVPDTTGDPANSATA